ncbi:MULTISPECIES: hypothetical protein [unclassified Mycolicibacterium]|uniref:hypothetical protein n=1 Tax=unclassified Mycolicibacterium TaxID=2636767 RepID=UPI002EDACF1C
MSFIHARFLRRFMLGDDVVMLAMDAAGVAVVHAALSDAVERGWSHLEHDSVTHEFSMEAGAADVALGDQRVEWRLDRATAIEILEDLGASGDAPGHHYVDIHTPAQTLVLSYDEYPPEYFEQLPEDLRHAKPPETSR